ncbi:cytochrome P450 CYP682H1 [Thozetella sp. PMI_491]|nr:cytochrome P450 CYP682H1 [Thozetella sp. PMI_491]
MTTPTLALALLAVAPLVALAIYRLYLSPLAKFPGPKLAALTGAYEGYFDCLNDGGGRYYVEINRMHEKYGPIVRINPWELHIRDPEWTEIYRVTRRASKPRWFYGMFGTVGNTFSTEDPDMHRMRRDAMQPYFSPAAVARHEPEVDRLVGILMDRLRGHKGKHQVVDIGDAFRCLATDVATAFVFRQPFGHLNHPDFEHVSNRAVRSFGRLGLMNRQTEGWLMYIMSLIPPHIAIKLNPAALGTRGFFKKLAEFVDRELKTNADGQGGEEVEANIIKQILRSNLPQDEKSPARIARECSSVTLAGTETSGNQLTSVTYYLLNNPRKLSQLREELTTAEKRLGRRLNYRELRDLPYLTGVINEGHRLSGVSGRLPRYDPKNDMSYNGYTIPKGTIVSTTQNDLHFSPDIFPEPTAFIPERWIEKNENKRLSKYLNPFGRGTRACLGMEVANLEIYITIARLFSQSSEIELKLHETNFENDVAVFHDFFSPFPKGLDGIRVLVE